MLAKMMLWGALFALYGLFAGITFAFVGGCLMVVAGVIGIFFSVFR